MRRNFTGDSFGQSAYLDEEDADPRVGLVNLADVMLVFACGLMLALVSYWNLDLPNMTELSQSDMQQVDDVETITEEVQSSTNPYMELGKVYQDPQTGKLYMLTEDTSGDGSEGAATEDQSTEGAVVTD